MKNSRYTWSAETKENPHPYICASRCPPGYTWRKEADMCVKILTTPATFTEAEVACAQGAKLIDFFSNFFLFSKCISARWLICKIDFSCSYFSLIFLNNQKRWPSKRF